MRRSEALALKWIDVNTKAMRVSIRRAVDTDDWTKSKPPEDRPRSGDRRGGGHLESARVLQGRPRGTLVHAREGRRLHLRRRRREAALTRRDDEPLGSPHELAHQEVRHHAPGHDHGLRHSHPTLLLELGEHPKVVQERLGHSTITTTINIYSHVTPTMQRSAVTRFAAHPGKA
ncbi:tyrosine-type recombinase/integrase [Microbacterium sp. KNMS]